MRRDSRCSRNGAATPSIRCRVVNMLDFALSLPGSVSKVVAEILRLRATIPGGRRTTRHDRPAYVSIGMIDQTPPRMVDASHGQTRRLRLVTCPVTLVCQAWP